MKMRRNRLSVFAGMALALSLGLAGCGDDDDGTGATVGTSGTPSPDKGKIVVGAANFAESTLLADMYAALLDKAGYDASVKQLTNREVYEPALEKGDDIQVFPEYAATLTEFLNKADNGADAEVVASTDIEETVAALEPLAEANNLVVGEPAEATDQNSFAVRGDFATQHNLTSLADLADFEGDLVLGGPSECPARTYCQKGLEDVYGIEFSEFRSLDTGGPLTKNALKNEKIDVGLVFSSDPQIETLDFTVLEDPEQLQNSDNIIPVVHESAADALPVLNQLSAVLTQEDLVALNKRVQVDHENSKAVAEDYLTDKGLL